MYKKEEIKEIKIKFWDGFKRYSKAKGRKMTSWVLRGTQIKEVQLKFDLNEKGAFVSNVNPEGPSKKAGIESGDVILSFNDIEIIKMTDLPRVVAESDVGSIANVEIWRKNTFTKLSRKSLCKKTLN